MLGESTDFTAPLAGEENLLTATVFAFVADFESYGLTCWLEF